MTDNLQERIAIKFSEQADKVARQMAARIGVPSDSQEIDTKEEVRLWNDSPYDDIPTAAHKLLMQNLPIDQIVDEIYPNRRKMMMQGRPNPSDWVQFSDKMKELTESGEYDNGELPTVQDRSGNSGMSVSPGY